MSETLRLFVVEYEHAGQQWRTVVEAVDEASARRQFQRDNPHVTLLACY